MAQAEDRRDPPTLAEIVREKTNDGLAILEFYIGALRDELEGFDTPHRLEAAQALLELVVDAVLLQRRWQGTTLAMVLGGDLDLFRRVVGFQVGIVERGGEDFTVRRRVMLAEQLRNCRALVDAVDAGGKFSQVFREETGGGLRIERFLRDVAGGGVDIAAKADRRSARRLLDGGNPKGDQAPCRSPRCCADWKASILDPEYVSQSLEDAHTECDRSDDD